MYRVQNGTLLPLDLQAVSPTIAEPRQITACEVMAQVAAAIVQDAPQRPTDDAEARQTQYEYEKAYRALHQAEERLEMYGRPDMAREVRTIRARLALGR
jgi:uncharacterized membrane protein